MIFQMGFISVIVAFVTIAQASALDGMSCDMGFGLELKCPLPFHDDELFCCFKSSMPYCCNFKDYVLNNTAIIAGVSAAAVILILAIILCCCCCCSCCLLAKRRQQRGSVLYGPVATSYLPANSHSHPVQPIHCAYTASAYQQTPVVHNPPPYPDSQPPYNPTYLQ